MKRFPALACWLFIVWSATAAEPVRLVTWNIADLRAGDQASAQHALDLFGDASDVISLQECSDPGKPLTASTGDEWHGVFEHSNAILSRWPILQQGLVAANPAWARDLPWADIQPPAGPAFRVYSVHLTFNRNGNPFIGEARAVEVRRILTHASGFPGPIILAGDFNTIGWILGGHESAPAIRLLHASGYADAFHGIGGRTQALLGRLDWIFTRGFAASDQTLGGFAGSDHRWLRATLTPSGATTPQPAPAFDGLPLVLVTFVALAGGLTAWRRRKKPSRSTAG